MDYIHKKTWPLDMYAVAGQQARHDQRRFFCECEAHSWFAVMLHVNLTRISGLPCARWQSSIRPRDKACTLLVSMLSLQITRYGTPLSKTRVRPACQLPPLQPARMSTINPSQLSRSTYMRS